MARARNIKPSFFTNDVLAEIAPLGRLLFQGLWCVADREGRLEDRPKKIKVELLPYDECDVNRLLDDLHRLGFILRYAVGEQRFIQVVNFLKHQNPHIKEAASQIPAPEEHSARTVQAPEEHSARTVQAPEIPEPTRLIPDSPIPLTDSPIPLTDSPTLIPDTGENTLSGKPDDEEDDDPPPEGKADLPGGIFAYWQRVMESPRSQLDVKRRRTIRAALKMGYSPHDLCRAIRGCSLTPHNMGQNDRGQKYNGIDLIFRSADQIDRFIANDSAPPKYQPASGVAAHNDALVAAYLARDGESSTDPTIIDMEH
ncbi:putative replication protein [Ralstonia phage RSK1]|uniref:Putative replication protein n=1 Tax=Ralstonia phage RSK1 TaxID=1417599 RepID=U6C6J3_9CAUD|nr:replication initiation protein [Ralstonia phage RSK1]BAO04714.1 putative replication protein [Ralstonia phage RSK1]